MTVYLVDPLCYCPGCNTLEDWQTGSVPSPCDLCREHGVGSLPLSAIPVDRVAALAPPWWNNLPAEVAVAQHNAAIPRV